MILIFVHSPLDNVKMAADDVVLDINIKDPQNELPQNELPQNELPQNELISGIFVITHIILLLCMLRLYIDG